MRVRFVTLTVLALGRKRFYVDMTKAVTLRQYEGTITDVNGNHNRELMTEITLIPGLGPDVVKTIEQSPEELMQDCSDVEFWREDPDEFGKWINLAHVTATSDAALIPPSSF